MVTGIGVSGGIALGPAFVLRPSGTGPRFPEERRSPEEEEKRLWDAHAKVCLALEQEAEEARRRAETETEVILLGYAALLRDPEIRAEMEESLQDGMSARETMDTVWDERIRGWSQGPVRLQERIPDLQDLKRMLRDALCPSASPEPPHGSILVVPHLSASDLMRFRPLEGVVCERGTRGSHVAVLLREAGIPAVFGVPSATERMNSGTRLLLDGDRGAVFPDPEPDFLQRFFRERETGAK